MSFTLNPTFLNVLTTFGYFNLVDNIDAIKDGAVVMAVTPDGNSTGFVLGYALQSDVSNRAIIARAFSNTSKKPKIKQALVNHAAIVFGQSMAKASHFRVFFIGTHVPQELYDSAIYTADETLVVC